MSRGDPSRPAESLRTFYRWGWVPLIAGCAVIAATVVLLSELILDATGVAPSDPRLRIVFIVRAVLTSSLLALWAGWFVLKSRQRIERVREQLRAQQSALTERAWRMEQAVGLGALSRVLAHEIRGPLHSIALQTAALRRRIERGGPGHVEGLVPVARQIEEDVDRLDGLLEEYMGYTHVPGASLVQQPVDLRDTIETVVAAYRPAFQARPANLELTLPTERCGLFADPGRLRELLSLLLRNALESVSPGGTVRVGMRPDADAVRVSVGNDGSPVERPDAVFRPFFSARRGHPGLALAIVRDIVRAHGGEVNAAGLDSGGLEITVRLPGVFR